MTFRTLIRRSLRCHWRAHLGVVLGAAVGSATLIGALVVGDSVRESLRERVLVRFGGIQVALFSGDRLFRAELAGSLTRFFSIHADELRAAGAETATKEIVVPVLQLPGTASTPDGAARANRVRVLGVDERFWKLANSPSPLGQIPNDAVILNQSLAERLRVKIGDEVLLRVLKPTLLSQDAPVAPKGAGVSVLRVAVHAVISDAELGRFSLRMESTPPFNAFVPLPSLQEATKETNRANLLLAPPASRVVPKTGFSSRDLARKLLWEHISVRLAKRIGLYDVGEVASPNAVADLQSILSSEWSLDDAEIQLQILPADSAIELRTRRVFLDHPVGFRLVDTSSSERRRIE